jgi:hypothetical protein
LFGLEVGLAPRLVVQLRLDLVLGGLPVAGSSFFLVFLLIELRFGALVFRVCISHTV